MSKLYTLLFITMLIIFSGCEANHADTNTTEERVVSDANITINENDLLKTNDTTPAFSGEYFNINNAIGISLSVGGATYKIYPTDTQSWTLDTEVPNVSTTDGLTLSQLTSGTLNLLTDGTYDIKIQAEDSNGTIYKVSEQIIIDTTTDAEVEIINIEKRINNKPKFTGESKNVYEQITLTLDGASFDIAPNTDGTWELDTNIQDPSTGTLNLISGQSYKVLLNAEDVDGNSIDQIEIDFNPGLLSILSAVYLNNNTDLPEDDSLYLYFNKNIDTATTQGSPNLYIDISGTGSIGTDSTGYAWHNIFDTYRIFLDSNSIEFDIDTARLSLTSGGISDSSGNSAEDGNQLVSLEKFNTLARLNTGDAICVSEDNTSLSIDCNDTKALKSDAYYKRTYDRNITQSSDIIYYINTGLSWQKEDDNIRKNYSDAKLYCETLVLDGLNNWKLPNMSELTSIVDNGTNSPAISNNYINTKSDIYWASNQYSKNINKHWGINFERGINSAESDTNIHYVRCVSVRE